jgi:hypothetical protein
MGGLRMDSFMGLWADAEKLGSLAQLVIMGSAIAALVLAGCQIAQARRIQREATAKDIFRDYLKLAFEYPQYASPKPELTGDEKYRWFVAFVLNTCDEIAQSVGSSEYWQYSIVTELTPHAAYLTSSGFVEDGGWKLYSPDLRVIWATAQLQSGARTRRPTEEQMVGLEKLKLLMTYTVFHIGLYTTLGAVLVAALADGKGQPMSIELLTTLGLFVLAGICGGLVGSHIPHFDDFDTFYRQKIGPWGLKLIPAWLCMGLEHIFFWFGIAATLIGLLHLMFFRFPLPQVQH